MAAKELQAPFELVKEVAERGALPVVLFTAGGIATPADAAMMMQLGADGVFVGSGIFKSGNPAERANAIVQATLHYNDPGVVAKVSRGLGEAMVGINVEELPAAAPPRRARVVTGPPSGSVAAWGGDDRGPCAAGRRARALAALDSVGARAVPVKDADALATVDGLVLPGGESTTISMLAVRWGLMEPLRAAVRAGLPMYGSCAGMILLADTILDGRADQQPASAGSTWSCAATPSAARSTPSRLMWPSRPSAPQPIRAVFIRAPWVESVGDRSGLARCCAAHFAPGIGCRSRCGGRRGIGSSPFGAGRCWPPRSTLSSPETIGCTRCSPSHRARRRLRSTPDQS